MHSARSNRLAHGIFRFPESSGEKTGFPDNERILLGLSGEKTGFPDNERILLGLSGEKAGFPDNELRQQKSRRKIRRPSIDRAKAR